jgi:hypothetical protein
MNDVERLKVTLAAMEDAEAKADEKAKPLFRIQKKLIQQRMEELK